MVTGTGTLSIEETFLGPQALPPPPTRHALFAILIALAVLLHFGTIGIGDLYSETEGQYAAAITIREADGSIATAVNTAPFTAAATGP